MTEKEKWIQDVIDECVNIITVNDKMTVLDCEECKEIKPINNKYYSLITGNMEIFFCCEKCIREYLSKECDKEIELMKG